MIRITENTVWDNGMKLHEQTPAAQQWYREHIAPLLSYYVPELAKMEYLAANGIAGNVPHEGMAGRYLPETDAWCRPSKWEFDEKDFHFEVLNTYMGENTGWNLDFITVKISENGKRSF